MLGKTININDLKFGEPVIAEIPALIRTDTIFPDEENNYEDFGAYIYVECCLDDVQNTPLEWYVWVPDGYDDYGVYDNWLTVKAKMCGRKGYDVDKLYISDYPYTYTNMYPIRFCEWDDRMKRVNEYVKYFLCKHIDQTNKEVAKYLYKKSKNDYVDECEWNERIMDISTISDDETDVLAQFYGIAPWVDIMNRVDLLEYNKRMAQKYIKERDADYMKYRRIRGVKEV